MLVHIHYLSSTWITIDQPNSSEDNRRADQDYGTEMYSGCLLRCQKRSDGETKGNFKYQSDMLFITCAAVSTRER